MSVFRIQRDLEDYLVRLGLEDRDQYAVRLANLYDRKRGSLEIDTFRARMSGLRTIFYRVNAGIERGAFESELLARLDRLYLKKNPPEGTFPGGVATERRRLQKTKRRTLRTLVQAFKGAVEARAVDSFWISRTRGELRDRPEVIAQNLLAMFATGVMGDAGGLVLKEFASGVGYVDVGIIFAKTLHLVEIKVLTHGAPTGVEQLSIYMRTEGRSEGWLIVIDSRPLSERHESQLPEAIRLEHGVVHLILIDINPVPPSRRRRIGGKPALS